MPDWAVHMLFLLTIYWLHFAYFQYLIWLQDFGGRQYSLFLHLMQLLQIDHETPLISQVKLKTPTHFPLDFAQKQFVNQY